MDSVGRSAATGTDAERLTAVEEMQEWTSTTVRELAATVKRLARAVPGAGRPSGPEVASADALVSWAGWLVERYELDLPACWPMHGSLVEELDALRVGWLSTIGAGQGGMAGMQWHDGLERAMGRMSGRAKSCRDGTHREPTRVGLIADGPMGVDEIDLAADRYRPDEGSSSD